MTDRLLDRLVVAVGTQYLVDVEIGRGGMAVVYRATDVRLNRRVAIKVLPPELAFNADVRERFLREAQTSARLAHPNIAPIYTVDEREGIVYFVMALVDGETLGQRLARDTRLPVEEARRIMIDVADALAYAHAQGVVHRDVKPDNVMLERATGRAVVTDFGIARAAEGDSRLTVTGVAIGTPAYMSPEQAIGERELDGRSDIYSLGVIAYHALSGETPFRASNTPAMLVKHVSETPRPLLSLRPDVPPGMAYAVMRALAKKPDDRWPDATSFRDSLSPTHDAAPPTPVYVPRREDRAPSRQGAPFAAPMVPPLIALPPVPAMPVWGSPADWRAWRQAQKRWEVEQRQLVRKARRGPNSAEVDAARPVGERVVALQRKAAGAAGTVALLAGINVLTSPDFFWFLIPTLAMGIGVVTRAGRLWADGVPVARLFSRQDVQSRARGVISAPNPRDAASALAPADVLAGPHGDAVRRAAADRAAAHETLARLAPAERDMISDVGPTVDALAERVGSIALTLHRLDADVGGASVAALDARLRALRAEAGAEPTAEQERRIALLERQRATIGELVDRRATLASQMESAGLSLQNLRLDLLKLRSSGLGGAVSDVNNATQEARALSREIGNAVDAVREVRRL